MSPLGWAVLAAAMALGAGQQPRPPLPPFIPPVTDADRRAAFPDVDGHPAHDNAVQYLALADQLEWKPGGEEPVVAWDAKGWVGRDSDRLWLRTEGERSASHLERAEMQVFYGRPISRWWDLVGGVRHDWSLGPSRTWVAVGVQGLAPYWFDVEATAYVGPGGRTHMRLEADYELRITQRLKVQPLLEFDLFGKADPDLGIGAGLSRSELGVRLRYEIQPEVAPYAGFSWDRLYFGTARDARLTGRQVSEWRMVFGVRVWR